MTGYLKIMPEDLNDNLNNVTVKLRVPKTYVEKDTIKLSEFISDAGEHQVLELKETEDYFEAGIFFPTYNCTHTVEIPFSLSFLDEITPTNYVLSLAATIAYDDVEYSAQETQYKPLYDDYKISKFVNSNTLWAFQNNGAEVLVSSIDSGDNPCLGDKEDVIFQFVPNAYDYKGGTEFKTVNYRDLCKITLTDTLPTYIDVNGNTRTAVLSDNNSSGWVLSADGKSVSKDYVGENTFAIIKSIQADSLRLWFPQLAYEKGADNFRIARLSNTVSMEGVPSSALDGEPNVNVNEKVSQALMNF